MNVRNMSQMVLSPGSLYERLQMLTNTVVPCIFPQPDDDEPTRRTWVRVEPSHWGFTIAIFKEQPTRETPEREAMCVIHVDACFMNQIKVQLWDEHQDSERDDGLWVTLADNVDAWRPREDEEAGSGAMEKRTIVVRVTPAQQMGLELEMATLFGLQVDDVHATGQPGEKLLTYVVGPEGMEQVERIVALLEEHKTSGAIIDAIVSGRKDGEGGEPLLSYRAELVVFSEEEVLAIVGASALDPWLGQGANASAGHGFVLAARVTSQLEEDVVIPSGVTGSRRWGVWIDGALADALPHFRSILGAGRTWRAWPESDLALVVADAAYENPREDPLIALLAQTLAFVEVHDLEELRLAFVDLFEGYLLVWNERGQFETWAMLPDGRGLDADLAEHAPVLSYQGDLFAYGNAYQSREDAEQAIRKELEK